MMTPFGMRLAAAMDAAGPLCVGIDPHPQLLAQWNLRDDPAGLRTFALRTVDALSGHVAAIKPQVAFFERHGAAGIAVLEELLAAAREQGVLTIADAKRGDIDSTMTAYAQAFLGEGSPLAADAVTLSPFLGFGSLRPALTLAQATGRGVFVLCLTSNAEGVQVQQARGADGMSVAARIAGEVAQENAQAAVLGSVGLVVAATIGTGAQDGAVDLEAVRGPLLAPGLGAQGGGPEQLSTVFGAASRCVLASSSREVLRAGPDVRALTAAAQAVCRQVRWALRGQDE